ncbi:MAG: hypothetical protein ACRCXT_07425 [Paraclostridium sp.]
MKNSTRQKLATVVANVSLIAGILITADISKFKVFDKYFNNVMYNGVTTALYTLVSAAIILTISHLVYISVDYDMEHIEKYKRRVKRFIKLGLVLCIYMTLFTYICIETNLFKDYSINYKAYNFISLGVYYIIDMIFVFIKKTIKKK